MKIQNDKNTEGAYSYNSQHKKITYILVVTMWSRTDYSSSIHVAYLKKMKVSLEKIYDTVAVNVEKIVLLLS